MSSRRTKYRNLALKDPRNKNLLRLNIIPNDVSLILNNSFFQFLGEHIFKASCYNVLTKIFSYFLVHRISNQCTNKNVQKGRDTIIFFLYSKHQKLFKESNCILFITKQYKRIINIPIKKRGLICIFIQPIFIKTHKYICQNWT